MTAKTVSISAASLQSSAEAAWEKVLDKIYALLNKKLAQAAEEGFFKTSFSIWDLSRDNKQKISDPLGGSMLNESDEEALWLMLFARLERERSSLRIKHSTDNVVDGTNAVKFFWGTAEQLNMTLTEFACLRKL